MRAILIICLLEYIKKTRSYSLERQSKIMCVENFILFISSYQNAREAYCHISGSQTRHNFMASSLN